MTTLMPAAEPRTASSRTAATTGYWAGALLIATSLLGSLVWVLLAWVGLMHHVDGFQRAPVPGTATARFTDTSARVLYFEAARGTTAFTPADVTVTGPGGLVIPVGAYAHDLRYDVPGDHGRVGRAVALFRPTTPGLYTISVATSGPGGTVAIGDDAVWNAVPHVAGAAALFLVGVGGGLTLIVVTAARRSRQAPGGTA